MADAIDDPAFPRPGAHALLADIPFLAEDRIHPLRGGRRAAEAALAAIDPVLYARSRNFVQGAVTRLSPYLTHGVLTLAEVRDAVLARVKRVEDAGKLVNELAWRDYWQRLYAVLGQGVWQDREEYKTGFAADTYAEEIPSRLLESKTGLACMDSFAHDLHTTGYLHNHARMWTAAYVVHHLRVRWQAGARWFLQHLLDGDPASNNLSWQWIASSFSNKPYFFNRENLERYTDGQYCRVCPVRGRCPFEGSYEDLEQKLFSNGVAEPSPAAASLSRQPAVIRATAGTPASPLVWIHTGCLNPHSELLTRYPEASVCFVWDIEWLRQEAISSKRVAFLAGCLAEMPGAVVERRGVLAAEVLAAAQAARADSIVTQRTPDPRLLAAAEQVGRVLPVVWIDAPRFADDASYDLGRFSRYWKKARASAMRPTA